MPPFRQTLWIVIILKFKSSSHTVILFAVSRIRIRFNLAILDPDLDPYGTGKCGRIQEQGS